MPVDEMVNRRFFSRIFSSCVALGLLASCGDSSGDAAGESIASGQLGFLSGYCTVPTPESTDVELWAPGPSGWEPAGKQTIAVGTPLFVPTFGHEAFAFTAGGQVRRLTRPDRLDFKSAIELNSPCGSFTSDRLVTLAPTRLAGLVNGKEVSCDLVAGESLRSSVSQTVGESASSFGGAGFLARCGFSPAYGTYVYHASLRPLRPTTSVGTLSVGEPGALATYCPSTTLRDLEMVVWQASGATSETGGERLLTVPAGTSLFVEPTRDMAYAFGADGIMRTLEPRDYESPWKVGEDIASECLQKGNRDRHLIFPIGATLFAQKDGSGASCVFAAGEGVLNDGLKSSGPDINQTLGGKYVVTLEGQSIADRCGFSPAYGEVFLKGELRLAAESAPN